MTRHVDMGATPASASESAGPVRPHDAAMMALAIAQAERGRGRTRPNPMVGAVIVDESGPAPRVLASGYHARAGSDHAEVAALRSLGGGAAGHTLYVTLEPCNHVGRTGRCTDAILAAGLRRVVCGLRDPNPGVQGGGLARLQAAGLDVSVGLLEDECRQQIRGYLRWIQTGQPHLILKAAVSLDGRLAPGPGAPVVSSPAPYWLTGSAARLRAHQLRDGCDAILVGAGTVLADDPRLNVRLPPEAHHDGHQPLRVVIDGGLRTPLEAALVGPGALILTSPRAILARTAHAEALRARGAEVLAMPTEGPHLSLPAVLTALGQRELLTVLCEGGSALHGALLRAGLYQEAAIFVAPLLLGDRALPLAGGFEPTGFAAAPWLRDVTITPLGRDVLLQGRLDPAAGGG